MDFGNEDPSGPENPSDPAGKLPALRCVPHDDSPELARETLGPCQPEDITGITAGAAPPTIPILPSRSHRTRHLSPVPGAGAQRGPDPREPAPGIVCHRGVGTKSPQPGKLKEKPVLKHQQQITTSTLD